MRNPAFLSAWNRSVLTFALIVWVAVACRIALDGSFRPSVVSGPETVVETVDLDQKSTVHLFSGPVDICRVGSLSFSQRLPKVRCDIVKSGRALFQMPDGGIRTGVMSGPDLVVFDIPLPVNLVSAQDLEAVSGIGPATARAIELERLAHGDFKKPRDLLRVKGIGPAGERKFSKSFSFESDF